MNAYDIELPPLPQGYCANEIRPNYARQIFLENQVKDYARAAIEADRKKFGRNDNDREWNENDHRKNSGDPIAVADALESADWSGVNIGNKALIKAAIDDLRKRRGEPVAHFYPWELERSLKAYPEGFPGAVAVYTAPHPAEPVRDVRDLVSRLRDADRPLLQQGKFSDVRNLLREAADFIARYGNTHQEK